jgi:hypothetical protein
MPEALSGPIELGRPQPEAGRYVVDTGCDGEKDMLKGDFA